MPIVAATGTANGESFVCGIGITARVVSYRYQPGSIVYICNKAIREGVLEAVCIKNVKIIRNEVTIVPFILYRDTFNRLWNEEELCNETDARNAAILYLEIQQRLLLEQLSKCQS